MQRQPHQLYHWRRRDLDALLAKGTDVTVTATSRSVTATDGSPERVLDGDPRTGWVAGPLDHDPALTFSFATPQKLTGIRVLVGILKVKQTTHC